MSFNYRVRDLVAELTPHEPPIVDACRTMTDHTDGLPAPRHLYSATFAGLRHPMRMLMTMQLAAIKAGAPVLDVLAPTRANEAWVRSHYPSALPGVVACLLNETHAESALNPAQAAALADASRGNLERMLKLIPAQQEALRQLEQRVRQELVRRRPSGWAA